MNIHCGNYLRFLRSKKVFSCFIIWKGIGSKKFLESQGYPKIAAAVIAGALILSIGTTSYAVYQAKNLRVFFEADVTEEELQKAGDVFRSIEGGSEVEYVPGEQAWADFQAEYFADDPELAQEFDENPLEDSFNYKLTVELSANTKEVREAIGKVEGVRMVSDLSELK